MSFENWTLVGVVVTTLACIACIVAAIVTGNASCPKGQQTGIAYWAPQYSPVTKMITVQPIYGCVSNG